MPAILEADTHMNSRVTLNFELVSESESTPSSFYFLPFKVNGAKLSSVQEVFFFFFGFCLGTEIRGPKKVEIMLL